MCRAWQGLDTAFCSFGSRYYGNTTNVSIQFFVTQHFLNVCYSNILVNRPNSAIFLLFKRPIPVHRCSYAVVVSTGVEMLYCVAAYSLRCGFTHVVSCDNVEICDLLLCGIITTT